ATEPSAGTRMTLEDFVHAYEEALASQEWALVEPLVHENACVTFSNGAVHIGKAAVQKAYEANFAAIEDEKYRISNVHWVRRGEDVAVYLFDFAWSGRIGGRDAKGSGRGTSVLVRHGSGWQLLAEHLGPPRTPAV
ncbi:MAG TPA: nuclear transport factor 2 family protein, partial [Candidatus Eisenbacteria bacterium]|nr:nuclear transport factor 2 family protein [Candidatus Eisenbacteria bacterium]